MKYSIEFREFRSKDQAGEEYTVQRVYLNGRDFIEIVKEYERQFADKEGKPHIAGQYEVQVPEELYKVLIKPAENITLLVCGDCREEGCWPLVMDIRVEEKKVIWSNFKNPHRPQWNYENFGPFEFEKDEYLSRVEKFAKSSGFKKN